MSNRDLPVSDLDLFAVGEIATYWRTGAIGHGMDVTIIGCEYRTDGIDRITRKAIKAGIFFELAEPPPEGGRNWLVTSRVLRKKRPPAELSTWDRCAWQPTQVSA